MIINLKNRKKRISAYLSLFTISSCWDKSDCMFSVHVAQSLHIPKCHRDSGGQRKSWPTHRSSCRLQYSESTQCSSRNQRLSTASRVWLGAHHKGLSIKVQKHDSKYWTDVEVLLFKWKCVNLYLHRFPLKHFLYNV